MVPRDWLSIAEFANPIMAYTTLYLTKVKGEK